MDQQEIVNGQMDIGAETRLWQAVILSAVEDWVSGPQRSKLEAEAYIFRDEVDFPRVCQSAGMNASQLRSRLKQLRQRSRREPADLCDHQNTSV